MGLSIKIYKKANQSIKRDKHRKRKILLYMILLMLLSVKQACDDQQKSMKKMGLIILNSLMETMMNLFLDLKFENVFINKVKKYNIIINQKESGLIVLLQPVIIMELTI